MDVPVKKARTPPRTGKAEVKPTTLLDVHEVEWITRELERLLAKEQQGGAGDDAGRHRRKGTNKAVPASKKGGFLAELLGKHAVSICSGDDAVDTTAASAAAGAGRGRRRRRGRGNRGFREVEKV